MRANPPSGWIDCDAGNEAIAKNCTAVRAELIHARRKRVRRDMRWPAGSSMPRERSAAIMCVPFLWKVDVSTVPHILICTLLVAWDSTVSSTRSVRAVLLSFPGYLRNLRCSLEVKQLVAVRKFCLPDPDLKSPATCQPWQQCSFRAVCARDPGESCSLTGRMGG